jgi:hypothetical protein
MLKTVELGDARVTQNPDLDPMTYIRKVRRPPVQPPKMVPLKAAIVPGVAGQFEGLVTTPDECILRIEAARAWFTTAELDAIESFVKEVAERKGRPALRVVG